MNELVEDVAELLRSRAAEAGVELIVQRHEQLPELMFDPELMHRAVLNVATNAIDACERRENGRVTLAVEFAADRSRLRVVVEDNGEGIEGEDLARIFTVFESSKGARGTGLGLPVSKKIVREHGGDIDVTSQVGIGSRFVLELPAVACESVPRGDTLSGPIEETAP
jgi:signal transduction histidine kinase